ncbi:TetR/AcrR family transcriptional regulator [Conexibacter sp. DBS9H8]|uniref:TetR/AcrR family transcriptional regulator n=1 Tax=Conexibacter sp. DBS9H8 TaxID=2937801 RepID=UPI00200DBE62|nr:TetR/AcrR family transcriptional regulator [Conexibacter sp. DBS9H8]
MAAPTGERRYGGKSATERQAERRERLLDTGLELFGTRGFANTSIELLCARAGLNARYFYAEFTGREELLVAVYDHHVEAVLTAVVAAVAAAPPEPAARLRAGLSTFMTQTFADPRAARVNYLEMVGVSPPLERRRREVLGRYADLVAAELARLAPGPAPPAAGDLRIAAVALVAATDGLIIDHLHGHDWQAPGHAEVDRIVGALVAIFSPGVGPGA